MRAGGDVTVSKTHLRWGSPTPVQGLLIAALAAVLAVALSTAPQASGAPAVGAASSSAAAATEVVAIRATINNKYVAAENGGNSSLIANRTAIGPWETFDLIHVNSTDVYLRSHANGKYVCAESGGAAPLISNRDVPALWETFQLINNSDGTKSLRARVNNKLVTAESAGGAPLIANRDVVGPWEKFDIVTATAPTPPQGGGITATQPTSPTLAPAGRCSGSMNDAGGPDPWGGCWPGPGNTGVPTGTQLAVVSGNQTYSTPNTTIQGLDIRGCVSVTAPGITIKNSKVTCPQSPGIDAYGVSGTRLSIEDVTVTCTGGGGTSGIGENNVTVLRANISGCENGFDADSDITVKDSYIHDLYQSDAAHTDGLQSAFGTNLLLQHNTIHANNGTSAIIINMNQPGCCVNTTISRNLMAGGAYTLYCPRSATTNFAVSENVFSKKFYPTVGAYGPTADCTGEIWNGNIYADTGQPVAQR